MSGTFKRHWKPQDVVIVNLTNLKYATLRRDIKKMPNSKPELMTPSADQGSTGGPE
jgi:hypothetical protein